MNQSSNAVTVSILDKQYQVACPPEERAGLHEAARYLDQQMRAIRDSGRVVGLERVAVMAALNISFELLRERQASGGAPVPGAETAPDAATLHNLNRKLDEALYQLRQLEIS